MKKFVWMTAFILWPVLATAQSTLNFPRSFTQQDRQSTGFAIVNPGPTDAVATFLLTGSNGAALASVNRTIPHGGQYAQLASELFPAITASGWVQITSATTGLQGFWIGGDFVNLNRGDGAVSAPLSTDQIFPFVPALTELSIVNPGVNSISVTIKGYNDSGAEVGTNIRNVTSMAISQFDISTVVQSGTPAYMRITSIGGPFAAAAVLRGTSSLDNAVQNGIDVTTIPQTANTLIFPQFVDGVLGTLNYTSVLSIVNIATRVVTVHFQFVPDGGAAPVESLDFPLGPQSSIKGMGSDFFQYREFGFHGGYVKVTADGPIAGIIDYGTVGGGEAIVPAQTNPQTNLIFAHIADLPPWFTGLAIENPSNATAIVDVFAMNPNGTLIGGAANVATARITLLPGTKVAKLLSDLIPQTQTRLNDGGFVYIRTNGVPIHAIQLLFTRDLKILANISAVPLAPGIIYNPPAQ